MQNRLSRREPDRKGKPLEWLWGFMRAFAGKVEIRKSSHHFDELRMTEAFEDAEKLSAWSTIA